VTISSISPAKIIARYLQNLAGNLPPSATWPVFYNAMPDGNSKGVPDDCIAVYDTTGLADGRYLRGGIASEIDHPGIQIRVRATDPDAAWAKAQLIADLMAEVSSTQVNVDGSIYTVIATSQSSPVVSIGQERRGDRRREIVTLNYLTTFSGDILMLASITSHGSSTTLSAAVVKGNYHTNGSAGASQIVLTLPPASEGLNATFMQVDPGALIVRPQAGESILWDGGAVTAGVGLSLQNVLSVLKLVSDGTQWLMELAFGTINTES